jgi:hypothetical protein
MMERGERDLSDANRHRELAPYFFLLLDRIKAKYQVYPSRGNGCSAALALVR